MAHGHSSARWDHTAELLAMIANTIPTEDGDPFTREDFHPFLQVPERRRQEIEGNPVEFLEQIGL